MSLLTKRIDALTAAQQDPYSAFRLEAAAVPPAAKWGKTVGWTPRDDAALLLGVYYYGLGHWEEIIGDEQLGLQSKLACVLESKDAGHNSASSAGTAGDKALHPKGERGVATQHITIDNNSKDTAQCHTVQYSLRTEPAPGTKPASC